jgi:ribonuclease P protein component
LKRCYSLKKNRDFQFTYRIGKSVNSRLCTLIYVRDRRKPKKPPTVPPPQPNVRVGFSVSKKVGNSVQRNRVKRRLRAALTPLITNIRPGYNLILIARPMVLDEPFEKLERSLSYLIEKADLFAKREQCL